MTQSPSPSAAQIVANYLRDVGAGVDEFSHYEDELVAQIDAFAASERVELLAALRELTEAEEAFQQAQTVNTSAALWTAAKRARAALAKADDFSHFEALAAEIQS